MTIHFRPTPEDRARTAAKAQAAVARPVPLNTREMALLAALTRAARSFRPCPNNFTLQHDLHMQNAWLIYTFRSLQERGLIVLERKGTRRRVIINATGERTDWSAHMRSEPRAPAMRKCLGGCGKLFQSSHPGHRICDTCKRSDDYKQASANSYSCGVSLS
ncbi:hypothetical protein [Methyloligella halotolerans]|uniref:hypothetical protein n=1 Tax=Methyloligella halotolerans TaxID=1177755 RepID=UPI00114CA0C3|nr:hypothetical protein [Methyloligella halotolerans]